MNNPFLEIQEHRQKCLAKMNTAHRTHCCTRGCKYGDEHCPVANEFEEGAYECEDCSCSKFHPELRFDHWWESLSQEQKEIVFNDYPGDF
jgi:hypothetical protein